MTQNTFVHLHVHTEFSLLDGLSRIKSLVNHAKELNMPALAITDHGAMFGVMDFYNECIEANIKPIIGVETYLARRGMQDRDSKLDRTPFHLLLLAKNQTGYHNLLKLVSEAQINGYYYRPRIDLDLLQKHSEGLIATSGCLAAKIPRFIQDGNDKEAKEWIGKFQDIFGKENFYLELQEHDITLQRELNQWIIDYSRTNHSDVGVLASTDLHYVKEGDFDIHDTLLCIQTGAMKADTNRLKFSDNSFFMYSYDQMMQVFKEIPEAVHNSVKIADMCEVDLLTDGYHLPVFPVPYDHTAQSYLHYLCDLGMDWRFGNNKSAPELQNRLDYELDVIHNMGFETYFLIVWDLCEFARHADIWWNVRGSGAGSLAAYCLGITNINPIQNNLLFERFLNPGRVSMPDIDLDYPDDRRGEMIAYTAQKYGEDKVAAIITFGTMGAKAAVRDVGRTLGVPLPEVNRAASLIPQEARQKPLMTYVEANPDLQNLYNNDPQIRRIFDTAQHLQGVNRHASTHAAGVIVADKPLVDYIPLHRVTGKDPSGGSLKAVTQFPMETCEAIGLLKVDFLGLSTLTILRKAADLIKQHHDIKYTMDNIPYRHDDDRLNQEQRDMLDQAFEMMGRGETVGVFQVESGGMQQMLRGMRPKKFENIVAAVSLYRPGPMEFIPQYNNRLHEKEEPTYHHEKLRPILEETYGIIVYQEQIMQIAGQLFGYELGEGDLMRKAVSKKREQDLIKHRSTFLERGPDFGVDADAANKIFDDIEFFANYGFNKAHASDYAVITVQTAFLKCHYPEEYMVALLSVQRDNSDKVAHFLEECRRLQIPILPPDVDHSLLDFDIQPDPQTKKRGIRFGLAAVKNAGVGALQNIVDARLAGDAFKDLEDFCKRIDLRQVGKRTIESLIKVGALSKFGKRSQLLSELDRIISFSSNYFKDKEVGQMNMFGEETGMADDSLNNLMEQNEVSDREMLGWEKELLGLYVTGRPVDKFREQLKHSNTDVIQELKQHGNAYHEKDVQIAGEIVNLRKIYTNSDNRPMGVIQLEDWHDSAASIEIVVFPRTWEEVMQQVEDKELTGFGEGEVVKIVGTFDTSRGDPQIRCKNVTQNFKYMTAKQEEIPPSQELGEPIWAHNESEDTFDLPAPHWVDEPPNDFESNKSHWIEEESQYDTTPELTHNKQFNDDPLLYSDDVPKTQYWVTIRLVKTDNAEADSRLLRKLHGLLTSYPGNDRFSIAIDAGDSTKIIEFPEHTTRYCDALLEHLGKTIDLERDMLIEKIH